MAESESMRRLALLRRRTRWIEPLAEPFCRFSLHGPRWVPGVVRAAPLRCYALVIQLVARVTP